MGQGFDAEYIPRAKYAATYEARYRLYLEAGSFIEHAGFKI
jgi:hypothetical protein